MAGYVRRGGGGMTRGEGEDDAAVVAWRRTRAGKGIASEGVVRAGGGTVKPVDALVRDI